MELSGWNDELFVARVVAVHLYVSAESFGVI